MKWCAAVTGSVTLTVGDTLRAGKKLETCQPRWAFLLPVPIQKDVKGQLFQIPSLFPALEGRDQDRLLRQWLRKALPLTCRAQDDGREGSEVA